MLPQVDGNTSQELESSVLRPNPMPFPSPQTAGEKRHTQNATARHLYSVCFWAHARMALRPGITPHAPLMPQCLIHEGVGKGRS